MAENEYPKFLKPSLDHLYVWCKYLAAERETRLKREISDLREILIALDWVQENEDISINNVLHEHFWPTLDSENNYMTTWVQDNVAVLFRLNFGNNHLGGNIALVNVIAPYFAGNSLIHKRNPDEKIGEFRIVLDPNTKKVKAESHRQLAAFILEALNSETENV